MHLSLLGWMKDHGTIKTQLFKGAIIFFFFLLNITIYPNGISIDDTLISIPFGSQSSGQWLGDLRLF